MLSLVVLSAAALVSGQYVPAPPPTTLTMTMSGVVPVLPPGFTGVALEEGAIIAQAPPNASYTPVFGPAAVQSNLPAATYVATLPSVPFNGIPGTVLGSVSGSTTQGQTGVTFKVDLSGLPDVAAYGPFMYHIHNLPVPADGNCTSTLGHFDTQNSGEYYMCDTAAPQNCQTGDLAGKHGKIMNSGTFSTSFNDPYLSTDPSSPYFFGSKSIVIHTGNTTRLTCANFQMSSGSAMSTGSASTMSVSNTTAPSMTANPVQYTGAATKAVAGGAVAGLAAIAGLLL